MTKDINAEFWSRHRTANDRMWRATYAAYISGTLTLSLALTLASKGGATRDPFNWYLGADGIITLALGWALGRGSRLAGALLLVRTVAVAFAYWERGYLLHGAISFLLFGGLYLRGLRGAADHSSMERQLTEARVAGV